jgi:hypothetical protein
LEYAASSQQNMLRESNISLENAAGAGHECGGIEVTKRKKA